MQETIDKVKKMGHLHKEEKKKVLFKKM